MKYRSKSGLETQKFAKKLLRKYSKMKLFYLYGDLASGKTTFVKGLAETFGLKKSQIKSPTFVFISDYGPFVHCDLYRLESMDESLAETILEYLEAGKTLFIEWPEVLESNKSMQNFKAIRIQFSHTGENLREIEVSESQKT